jgi:hypothetical protein
VFFKSKKRQLSEALAEAMQLLGESQAVFVRSVDDFKTTVTDLEKALALLLEASQQRDRAIATADAAEALLAKAVLQCSVLTQAKRELEQRLRSNVSTKPEPKHSA